VSEPSDRWSTGHTQVARDVLYRSLFEHALVEVHIWEVVRDAAGAIVTWRLVEANAAALRSWGQDLASIVGRTADEVFPGAEASRTFLPIVEAIMSSGEPKEWESEFAGTGQILHMVSIPVGEYFVSTGFDVTADRRRERELQHTLLSLTQATRAGGVGLWDWDLVRNEVNFTDEWKRQLGHEPDEISNAFDEWKSRVHPEDLASTLERVRANIDNPGRSHDVVFRMRHKDGSYRWILAQSSTILDDDGRPVRMLGSHIDITERRRLEERVGESQKLEAIGTLAAGIAHDFNNLLGAITGNLSLLRDASPTDPDTPSLLNELDEATHRAQALTYQLLTFAKGGAPIREVTSIRELLMDSARFVTRGSRSRCEFSLPDDLPAVEVDVGQLSQVINNLTINAMQAMPDGGTIHIGASPVTLDVRNDWGLAAGPHVRISVRDEGMGIPPEHLPRIFDPFFTTKTAGSGLGLSSSYAIIARHGGRITVDTRLGQGTTFHVFLPASGATPRARAATPVVTGSGRVLVMDDDPSLRTLLRRVLERLGYACEVTADGDEATSRYTEALRAGQPFDAVILDLTIPGKAGGTEVLARLKAIDPSVVAIVTSGYADDDVLARYDAHGFRGRLRKPTDIASMSAELARVLR
jgi:PAS domain S-box-containing protein